MNYVYKKRESVPPADVTYEVYMGERSLGSAYRVGSQWFSVDTGMVVGAGPFKTRELAAGSLSATTASGPPGVSIRVDDRPSGSYTATLDGVTSAPIAFDDKADIEDHFREQLSATASTSLRASTAVREKLGIVSRVKGFFARA